jgi:hypothetical protein
LRFASSVSDASTLGETVRRERRWTSAGATPARELVRSKTFSPEVRTRGFPAARDGVWRWFIRSRRKVAMVKRGGNDEPNDAFALLLFVTFCYYLGQCLQPAKSNTNTGLQETPFVAANQLSPCALTAECCCAMTAVPSVVANRSAIVATTITASTHACESLLKIRNHNLPCGTTRTLHR